MLAGHAVFQLRAEVVGEKIHDAAHVSGSLEELHFGTAGPVARTALDGEAYCLDIVDARFAEIDGGRTGASIEIIVAEFYPCRTAFDLVLYRHLPEITIGIVVLTGRVEHVVHVRRFSQVIHQPDGEARSRVRRVVERAQIPVERAVDALSALRLRSRSTGNGDEFVADVVAFLCHLHRALDCSVGRGEGHRALAVGDIVVRLRENCRVSIGCLTQCQPVFAGCCRVITVGGYGNRCKVAVSEIDNIFSDEKSLCLYGCIKFDGLRQHCRAEQGQQKCCYC